MQKEKWLNALIFDTGLFDAAALTNEEKIIIKKYLPDKKTPEQIAKKSALPVDEVKKIIKTGIKKILLTSKEILAKKIWFQQMANEKKTLQNELETLRERFKIELVDEKLTEQFERLNVPVSNLFFSRRAEGVFRSLNIKTLNGLAGLSLYDLKRTRNAGCATVNEIVRKAREIGISIT